jgi:hypothetical protein
VFIDDYWLTVYCLLKIIPEVSTSLNTLFNFKKSFKIRCFKLEILYMMIREKGKLRDLGMIFKPSFKCFKNEKINFI